MSEHSYTYQDVIRFWRQQNIKTAEDYQRILSSFKVLFSYHSGTIENDRITYGDTREIFENGIVTSYTGDLLTLFEIQNMKDCYEYVIEQAAKHSPLTEKMICRIHKLLTKGTYDERRYVVNGERPGEYKKHDYVTGKYETGSLTEDVAEEMYELVQEINSVSSEDPENIITMAAYAHNVIEHVHPFADGNGRVGRMVADYLLLIHDLPPLIIFDEDRKLYYEALEAFDLYEDLHPTIELFRYEMEKTWRNHIIKEKDEKKKRKYGLADYL